MPWNPITAITLLKLDKKTGYCTKSLSNFPQIWLKIPPLKQLLLRYLFSVKTLKQLEMGCWKQWVLKPVSKGSWPYLKIIHFLKIILIKISTPQGLCHDLLLGLFKTELCPPVWLISLCLQTNAVIMLLWLLQECVFLLLWWEELPSVISSCSFSDLFVVST